ncbi:hypothetical protein FAM09_21180 [Niastella caeni]|uniref:Outer membrane protein beta-barrel domain-containing protein n=1 Tax=Niastella caeni TaxID=2569763 RepID=A0A4S8HL20_9BACT|nr:outer membrane beta-barrel protein [Niastella caeni]THU35907.1 hypothetical protein FAM09_21180 [Niastella caeni]
MSDHEFEKQVHQKLEELKLRPSDTVWMEVQKKISQDKRRRRFLWLWLPMLFICLTTSGYILYRFTWNTENTSNIAKAVPASISNEPNAETSNISTKQTSTIKPVSNNNSQTQKNTTAPIQKSDNNQPDVITPAAAHETTSVSTLSSKKQPAIVVTEKNIEKKTIGSKNKKQTQQTLVDYANGNIPIEGMNNITPSSVKPRYRKKKAAKEANAIKDAPVQQELVRVEEVKREQEEAMNVTMPTMVNDVDNSIATNKAVTMPFMSRYGHLLRPDSLSAANAAVSIPRKRPSLWHWGVVADVGYSRIAESKLLQLRGLFGEKYLAEDLSPSASPTGVTSGANSFNFSASTSSKKASPIQPDLSYSVGVFVQRALSPRFKLSLGVEYTYMSVNTQVGQNVKQPIVISTDTVNGKVVPEYYKTPGYSSTNADATLNGAAAISQRTYYDQKYRYRFQYLEIPVLANWQINKGRKLPPVVLEGGVSISHLLSVDALHFEGARGIYYKDNSLFNKTQFNFLTGISVGLLQRSKHPVWVGPNLRYSLNGLVDKNVSTGQYLWSTGISIKMLLGRL